MNDYRAAGQELQGQVLAAARKGQQRVATTMKNVTAAAQQIRPQLANLPKPTINISSLPGPAQLREKAPELVARLQTRLPAKLPTKLPTADEIRSGAAELAGHARSVQRMVAEQVRGVATPIAHQAAARLAQVGTAVSNGEITTRVSQVTVKSEKTAEKPADKAEETAKSGPKATKDSGPAKPRTRSAATTTRKPRAKTATK